MLFRLRISTTDANKPWIFQRAGKINLDDRLALVQVGNGKIADKKFIVVVMDLRVSTRTGGIEFLCGIITALVFLL